MPEPPPFGINLPAGTILAQPDSLVTATRTTAGAERPFNLWFVYDPANGGGYTSGYECADWPVLREVPAA